jgi:hypothetical protein
LFSNGTNAAVYALALDGSNQKLYIGGSFSTSYGNDISNVSLSTSRITAWNLNNKIFERLGTSASNGTNNTVFSLVIDNVSRTLYAGGQFTSASDSIGTAMQINYVANWDIINNKWGALGAIGTNNNGTGSQNVNSLIVDEVNRLLYIGGSFTTSIDSRAFKLSTNGIVVWNIRGNQFIQTGVNLATNNGITGGTTSCNAMVLDSTNLLYVGGQFTTVNDAVLNQSASNIAIWNNTIQRWILTGTNVQNGLNGPVNSIVKYKAGNVLYMGGNFTRTNDSINANLLSNYITTWDLSLNMWFPVGVNLTTQNGITAQSNTLKIDSFNNDLYNLLSRIY